MDQLKVVLAALAVALCALPSFAAMPAGYSSAIDIYRRAMAEHWEKDWDLLEEHGIPVEFRYGGEEPEITASLFDVDVDGSPELVIYDASSRYMLWNAYTMKDGEAVRLFTGAARDRWYLTQADDGAYLFENEGSSGASNSVNFYYALRGGELVFVRGVIYDEASMNRMNAENDCVAHSPWFATTTDQRGHDDYVDLVPIDEAEANAVTSMYESRRVFPEGERVASSSAAVPPDVYRELAQNFVKALTHGSDAGLCNDDDSDGDLGGGLIYDGSGEAALARVGCDEIGDPERPWQLDGELSAERSASAALDAIAQRCEPASLSFTPFADLASAAVPDIEVVMPQVVLKNASELPELAEAIEAYDRKVADHIEGRLAEVRERFRGEIDPERIRYELSELAVDRADERMVSLRAIFRLWGVGAVNEYDALTMTLDCAALEELAPDALIEDKGAFVEAAARAIAEDAGIDPEVLRGRFDEGSLGTVMGDDPSQLAVSITEGGARVTYSLIRGHVGVVDVPLDAR